MFNSLYYPWVFLWFFFVICLPYVSPVKSSFDVQPTVFILSIVLVIFVLLSNFRMPSLWFKLIFILFLFISLRMLCSIAFNSGSVVAILREYFGYVNILISLFLGKYFYNTISSNRHLIKYIKYVLVMSVGVWFVFGLLGFLAVIKVVPIDVTMYFTPRAMTFAGHGRGTSALASEPSMYSVMCYYFFIFAAFIRVQFGLFFNKCHFYIVIVLLLAQMIVFASSGTGMILAVAMVLYLLLVLEHVRFSSIIYTVFLFSVGLLLLYASGSVSGLRGWVILNKIQTNGFLYIFQDSSIMSRVFDFQMGLKGLWEGFPFGMGFGAEDDFVRNHSSLWYSLYSGTDEFGVGEGRLGALSSILFETGLLGILFLVSMVYPAIHRKKVLILVLALFFPFLFSGSKSLALPFVLLGMMLSSCGRWLIRRGGKNIRNKCLGERAFFI